MLPLLAFQKQLRSYSGKFLKIRRKRPLVCEIFKKHSFYRTPLDDCFWLFRATLLKWGTANNVWKTSDEYSLCTNLRSTVQVYHFLFGKDRLLVYVFIGLHCLLPETAIRVEVFCKKGVLKDFVNFIGKHLRWSLFLISCRSDTYFKEHLPLNAFALHSHHSLLLIRFTLYSAPSSSSSLLLLLISPMFAFGSNSKGFKEFKSGISFSLKSLSSLLFSFSMFFLSFSVLFHFFLSLLIKRILLSWELIKMFLPPLTSLKYVHVNK